MNKRKMILAGVLAASMALSGCVTVFASETADGIATIQDTAYPEINIGISVDPGNLAPTNSVQACHYLYPSIYEKLFTLDGFGGELTPILAESYEAVDARHYRVTIYDYIYDTAGNHLTASDVAFSYNTLIDFGSRDMGLVESVEAIDDYTVEFTWTKDAVSVGDVETVFDNCYIFTQAAYEASSDGFATDPVGTSPYVVTEFSNGFRIVLEKADSYWQTDASKIAYSSVANVDKINFYIITEGAQMVIGLKGDTIDFAPAIDYTEVPNFEEGGEYGENYEVLQVQDNLCYELLPNVSEESPCSDPLVRQAIAYAIDNAALAGALNGGNVMPAYTLGNSNFGDYNEAWESADNFYTTYDPEKAKELLAEAGYGDGLTMTLYGRSGDDYKNISQMIQAFLGQIGITVEIELYDEVTLNEYQTDPAKWDILLAAWASGGYLVNEWAYIFSGDLWPSGLSENFIDDPTLTEMLASACTYDGHTEEAVNAFHQYVVDNAYGYGMISYVQNTVYSTKFEKLVFSDNGMLLPGACSYAAE